MHAEHKSARTCRRLLFFETKEIGDGPVQAS